MAVVVAFTVVVFLIILGFFYQESKNDPNTAKENISISSDDQYLLTSNSLYYLNPVPGHFNTKFYLNSTRNGKIKNSKELNNHYDFGSCELISTDEQYVYFSNAAGSFSKIDIGTGELSSVSEEEILKNSNITIDINNNIFNNPKSYVFNGKTYFLENGSLCSVSGTGEQGGKFVYDINISEISYACLYEDKACFYYEENDTLKAYIPYTGHRKTIADQVIFKGEFNGSYYAASATNNSISIYKISGMEKQTIFESNNFGYTETSIEILPGRYIILPCFSFDNNQDVLLIVDIVTGNTKTIQLNPDSQLISQNNCCAYSYEQNNETYICFKDLNTNNFSALYKLNVEDLSVALVNPNELDSSLLFDMKLPKKFYDENYSYACIGGLCYVTDKTTGEKFTVENPYTNDELIIADGYFFCIGNSKLKYDLYHYDRETKTFNNIFNSASEITDVIVKDKTVVIKTTNKIYLYNIPKDKLTKIKSSEDTLFTVDFKNSCLYTAKYDKTSKISPLKDIIKTSIS